MSNFLTFQWMTFRVLFVKIPLWISQYLIDNNSNIFMYPKIPRNQLSPCWSSTRISHVTEVIGWVNSSLPEQNGSHFVDDIFRRIFLNENVWISIKISLAFIPKGSVNNIPILVQIMAWRRSGDNPLSEPMKIIIFSTHTCVTRPQLVNAITYPIQ